MTTQPEMTTQPGVVNFASAPNFFAIGSNATWKFNFLWAPVALRFTVQTSATVEDRRVEVDVGSREANIRYNYIVPGVNASGLIVPASTTWTFLLMPTIQATCVDVTTGIVQAQLPQSLIVPEALYRLMIADAVDTDIVTDIRLQYIRL